MPIDVQCEYIKNYPQLINSVDKDTLISLLQYDIELIKHINISKQKKITFEFDDLVKVK